MKLIRNYNVLTFSLFSLLWTALSYAGGGTIEKLCRDFPADPVCQTKHLTFKDVFRDVVVAAGTGYPGYKDGIGTTAILNRPHGLAQSHSGIIYFADRGNHQIRTFDPNTNEVNTIAGNGEKGFLDGSIKTAKFNQPVAVTVSRTGTIYVADRDNHMIRAISPTGIVSTFAGTGLPGYIDGASLNAKFNEPYGVVLDKDEQNLLVADYLNHAIRIINLTTGIVSTFAGNGQRGSQNGFGASARFNQPYNIIRGSNGNYFVPDQKNHSIRKITIAGEVTTVAGGNGQGYLDGKDVDAKFNNPTGLAITKTRILFVSDRNNHRIRKIDSAGIVTTLAGTGLYGEIDGSLEDAQFNKPLDIIVDKTSGNLIISEDSGHKLRRVRLKFYEVKKREAVCLPFL